jgi:hypothetical protein
MALVGYSLAVAGEWAAAPPGRAPAGLFACPIAPGRGRWAVPTATRRSRGPRGPLDHPRSNRHSPRAFFPRPRTPWRGRRDLSAGQRGIVAARALEQMPEPLPADLARVVAAWPDLPAHIKAAVLALVGAAR